MDGGGCCSGPGGRVKKCFGDREKNKESDEEEQVAKSQEESAIKTKKQNEPFVRAWSTHVYWYTVYQYIYYS